MLRDKDYLRTTDDLIFNVIGYDHAPGRATANLKYVGGKKWTGDYRAALDWLTRDHPDYVDRFISIPLSRVAEVYCPADGLRRLLNQSSRTRLEDVALDLARQCADFFDLPWDRFGVTDSLLWGRGNDDSDIDLVVLGRDAAQRVIDRRGQIFESPNFARFSLDDFERPADAPANFAELCWRKFNLGRYRGVPFSLRAVRDFDEIQPAGTSEHVGMVKVTARVVDNTESLFFPAIYQLDSGHALASYAMQYEAVFDMGDVLTITGTLETGSPDRILIGAMDRTGEEIILV